MMTKRIFTALVTILLTTSAFTTSQTALARGNGGGGGSGLTPLSETEIADLYFMREEEKLARDSYLVLGAEYGLAIFDNISESEQRHMDALKKLIDKYGLTDPVEDEDVIGGFVDPELLGLFEFLMVWGFQSSEDGLRVGAVIEETDIEDIWDAIEHADHDDIIDTYESLLCGSRNHLRAFVGQIKLRTKVEYEPLILTEDELAAIVDTKMEKDCDGGDSGKSNRGGKRIR